MNLTPENVLQFHEDTLCRIINEDYYPNVFMGLAHNKKIQFNELISGLSQMEDLEKICSFWNEFWNALPDHPAIRTGPFFDICDLAEGSYLETGDYEYEQTEDYRNSL